MMPPYVEYKYECICGNTLNHGRLCRLFNLRNGLAAAEAWQETGIARHWREQAELEQDKYTPTGRGGRLECAQPREVTE